MRVHAATNECLGLGASAGEFAPPAEQFARRSDLEIGPDRCLYLLSDESSRVARLDDLPAGGGTAALLDARRLGDLDGKPEGLTFTPQGRAIVGLDTHKPRRNLVLLEPAVAQ
jgi:hypothetical protein